MKPTAPRNPVSSRVETHEQLTKLGSIGREVIGTDLIRLYDEDGNLITEPNKVGELYSQKPDVL